MQHPGWLGMRLDHNPPGSCLPGPGTWYKRPSHSSCRTLLLLNSTSFEFFHFLYGNKPSFKCCCEHCSSRSRDTLLCRLGSSSHLSAAYALEQSPRPMAPGRCPANRAWGKQNTPERCQSRHRNNAAPWGDHDFLSRLYRARI